MKHNCYIELLTPRQSTEDLEADLSTFALKFNTILETDCIVSVPDNPMGVLHFQATEVLSELGLSDRASRILLHINTFHPKPALDTLLNQAKDMGITRLLVVTGDGSERLAKLDPLSIGSPTKSVTSVELLRYIHRTYPASFVTGVAFNPYEPQDHELEKLERKIDAGASFIITQPVIGSHPAVDALGRFGRPIAVDAWMSKKLHLLSSCVGYAIPEDMPYDPIANLRQLRSHYPEYGLYLALLGFKSQLPLLPTLLN